MYAMHNTGKTSVYFHCDFKKGTITKPLNTFCKYILIDHFVMYTLLGLNLF